MAYSATTTTEKNLYSGGSASTVLYTDRRDFYVQPQVVKTRYPNVAPFLTAVSNWGQRTGLKDPQYKLFQFIKFLKSLYKK